MQGFYCDCNVTGPHWKLLGDTCTYPRKWRELRKFPKVLSHFAYFTQIAEGKENAQLVESI